jgi:hypothetical protein
MNIIPTSEPDMLPIIFLSGCLIGIFTMIGVSLTACTPIAMICCVLIIFAVLLTRSKSTLLFCLLLPHVFGYVVLTGIPNLMYLLVAAVGNVLGHNFSKPRKMVTITDAAWRT